MMFSLGVTPRFVMASKFIQGVVVVDGLVVETVVVVVVGVVLVLVVVIVSRNTIYFIKNVAVT